MLESCINHPDHAAIEHCEVCNRPLCALCIWYTADGHRLCAEHAQARETAGETVLPPHTYSDALAGSLLQKHPERLPGTVLEEGRKVYRGNSHDLTALVAALIGVTTLASCFGGAYCLPLFAFLLGALAYFNADQAVDTRRTKNLAIAGMSLMGLLLLLMVSIFLCYFMGIFMIILTEGGL